MSELEAGGARTSRPRLSLKPKIPERRCGETPAVAVNTDAASARPDPAASQSPVAKKRAVRLWRDVWPALARAFPALFGDKRSRQPLKVGIAKDLDAARVAGLLGEVTLGDIKAFLRLWTQAPAYWRGLTGGAPRFDLRGHEHGFVAYAEAAQAREAEARYAENRKQRMSILSNRRKSHKESGRNQDRHPRPAPSGPPPSPHPLR